MLLALSLKDFVIVDELNLNFQTGLTVITGETGAGKSITLDALGLLLGDKADFSQVRTGQKSTPLRLVRHCRLTAFTGRIDRARLAQQ